MGFLMFLALSKAIMEQLLRKSTSRLGQKLSAKEFCVAIALNLAQPFLTTPDEIQLPEKCIFHIKLNGEVFITSVTDTLYDSVSEGDRVFVRYSQERFSKKIHLKKIKSSQNP